MNTKRGKFCIDHKGNRFESYSAMCRYWKISPALFKNRRHASVPWTLEEMLTTPPIRTGGKREQHFKERKKKLMAESGKDSDFMRIAKMSWRS